MPVTQTYGSTFIRIDGAVKQALEQARARLLFAVTLVVFGFVSVVFRLVTIAWIHQPVDIADETVDSVTQAQIARGEILDRNGVMLATNLITQSLYANPREISSAKDAAVALKSIFPDTNTASLQKKLEAGRDFIWIRRNLSPQEQFAVNNLGIPGLYFQPEQKRIYPHGHLFSHVLGIVGQDGIGLSGMEKTWDKELRANDDDLSAMPPPKQLSLDVRVQDVMYAELAGAMQRFHAIGATGIVLDANNGEIISLVSLPDFDPNNPDKINPDYGFNRASYGIYEMGSVFKAFTMAMALDSGKIALNHSFDASKPIRIARYVISDFHPENRWLTLPEIFKHSSNIGTAKIAVEIGEETQKKFLKKLGLLDVLPLELPERGVPLFPKVWKKVQSMTIAYGHGIAVTPLHAVAATAAMVNGGIWYKPSFIKHDGEIKGERVIKKQTSNAMRKLFHLVVADGTGEKAEVPGYLVGGKTGTSEKIVNGRYDTSKRISSFIGAFPMHQPKYVVLVMLDEPKAQEDTFGYATGGWTAAPAVARIIAQIAPLLGVSPVDEESIEIKEAMRIEEGPEHKHIAAND